MGATAVLALHYQNDVLHPLGRIRLGLAEADPARDRVIAAGALLLREARARSWPIWHVRIAFRPDYADMTRHMAAMRMAAAAGALREGEWGVEFHPDLMPLASANEFVVTHTRVSAFYGTPLEAQLRLVNASRLVVAGVATHSAVEGTVRDAADRGFEVWVAADACAAADINAHNAALASMRLVANVSDVAGVLLPQGPE